MGIFPLLIIRWRKMTYRLNIWFFGRIISPKILIFNYIFKFRVFLWKLGPNWSNWCLKHALPRPELWICYIYGEILGENVLKLPKMAEFFHTSCLFAGFLLIITTWSMLLYSDFVFYYILLVSYVILVFLLYFLLLFQKIYYFS